MASKVCQKGAKGVPRGTKWAPGGLQGVSKGCQRGPPGYQMGAPAANGVPNGRPGSAQCRQWGAKATETDTLGYAMPRHGPILWDRYILPRLKVVSIRPSPRLGGKT